eukprot:924512-Prorocentrum_minimum.AAC.1
MSTQGQGQTRGCSTSGVGDKRQMQQRLDDATEACINDSSIIPPSVRAGDRVSIISPSGPADPQYLEPAMEIIRQWGLIPVVASNVSYNFQSTAECAYLAGSDEERLKQLIGAFEDPTTKAVVCSRGGYGSARLIDALLDTLPFEVLTRKRFVGFSDITVLHSLFQYAPNLLPSGYPAC